MVVIGKDGFLNLVGLLGCILLVEDHTFWMFVFVKILV